MNRPRMSLPALLRNAAWALLTLFMATGAFADPPGRVGRLADFTGTVWFLDPDQGEWTQAARNRPLTTGDRLSTERDARAELQIGSTMLRLDGGTELQFVQIDDDRVRVHLHNGSVALRVRSREVANEIEIVTDEGRFMPMSTGHFRIDRRDGTSLAGSWSGDLRFEAPDSTLDIGSGQRAEFWADGAQRTTHYTWSSMESDRFAQWAADEDRRDDRRAASRYVSPEMTGADDLDRYGRWDTHPEYGALWLPHHVAPGWAPYRMGHWAWVQPWGWTWVDDARWGFAPFHYGRWVSWRGQWCWAPGGYVARPVYAPALVAWIGGGHVSVGVSIGSRPAVGWVPLGPREVWVPGYRVSPRYHRDVNRPHWREPSRRPAEPIMYTNRGVPGGVTVVPANVLRDRQPVSNAVVSNVDPGLLAPGRWRHEAPPAPPARRAAPPAGGGDAVMAPPGRVPEGRRVNPRMPSEPVVRAVVPPAVVAPAPLPPPQTQPQQAPQPRALPRGDRPAEDGHPRGRRPPDHPAAGMPFQSPAGGGEAVMAPPGRMPEGRRVNPRVPSEPVVRAAVPPAVVAPAPLPQTQPQQAPQPRALPRGERPAEDGHPRGRQPPDRPAAGVPFQLPRPPVVAPPPPQVAVPPPPQVAAPQPPQQLRRGDGDAQRQRGERGEREPGLRQRGPQQQVM